MNNTETITVRPLEESGRIVSMDALRGFALLGILVINIQSFSMIGAAYLNPTAYGDLTGTNLWVWVISHVLFDQKFMGIFSLLFGAGILLLAQRAEEKGVAAFRVHYRRMGWLLAFGLLHAHLLWYGDILFIYGICGMLVFLLRKLSPRALLLTAAGVAAVGSFIYLFFGLSMPYWPPASLEGLQNEAWKPTAEMIEREITTYRGSWLDQQPLRMAGALFMETGLLLMVMLWKVSSLMLIGMAFYKTGVLNAARTRRFYGALVALGFLVGVPIVSYGVWKNFEAEWSVSYSFFIGSQYNYWASYLVAVGWIGCIMLVVRSGWLTSITRVLAAVGRMAFSNYILQTLVCTTLFYGHGLSLFGKIDRAHQALIVIAICVVQLIVSPIWLRRFRFGPLEWAWRSLTYGRRQPFRREATI